MRRPQLMWKRVMRPSAVEAEFGVVQSIVVHSTRSSLHHTICELSA